MSSNFSDYVKFMELVGNVKVSFIIRISLDLFSREK
jgi:hypothetical protein